MNPILILLSVIGTAIFLNKKSVPASVNPSASNEPNPTAPTQIPTNINIGQIGATTSAFKLGNDGDGI